jgi:hypothetical protein
MMNYLLRTKGVQLLPNKEATAVALKFFHHRVRHAYSAVKRKAPAGGIVVSLLRIAF